MAVDEACIIVSSIPERPKGAAGANQTGTFLPTATLGPHGHTGRKTRNTRQTYSIHTLARERHPYFSKTWSIAQRVPQEPRLTGDIKDHLSTRWIGLT